MLFHLHLNRETFISRIDFMLSCVSLKKFSNLKIKMPYYFQQTTFAHELFCDLEAYAPVICSPVPLGAGDTGDIARLKCRNLTSDVSRQCHGCAGVLISR